MDIKEALESIRNALAEIEADARDAPVILVSLEIFQDLGEETRLSQIFECDASAEQIARTYKPSIQAFLERVKLTGATEDQAKQVMDVLTTEVLNDLREPNSLLSAPVSSEVH